MNLPWKLPLLLDGATGTQMLAAGMPGDICPEQWMLEHPDILIALQRRYVLAGCNVLYTPTFGANRTRLAAFGLEEYMRPYNLRLVELTRQAIAACPGSSCLVAGCLAPTGLRPEPVGDTPIATLEAVYAEQAALLKEAGVDLLVCETMTSLSEARAALLATRETGLPVFVTLTVNKLGQTLTGGTLLPAVITLQALGAAAIGLNCSVDPTKMVASLVQALSHAAVPLIAKPSALTVSGEILTPAQFGNKMKPLLDAGASIVGGCCGTTPEYLAILRGLLDKHPLVAPREIDTDACAVEKEALFLSDDLNPSEPIACDSALADALIEAEDTANVALVELTCQGDIGNLLEFGGMSRLPIALHTDNALLLDEALHRFPGRLLVDSLCEISRPLLEEIAARYGAVVY